MGRRRPWPSPQLDNGSVADVPVPLADVSPATEGTKGSNAGWTSLGALALILAMASLVMVRVQPPPHADRNVWSTLRNRPLMRKNEIPAS